MYVPIGTKSLYESLDGWKLFFQIIEMDMSALTAENIFNGYDPTGISVVKADSELKEKARYSIDGRKLTAPQKGINIIRINTYGRWCRQESSNKGIRR